MAPTPAIAPVWACQCCCLLSGEADAPHTATSTTAPSKRTTRPRQSAYSTTRDARIVSFRIRARLALAALLLALRQGGRAARHVYRRASSRPTPRIGPGSMLTELPLVPCRIVGQAPLRASACNGIRRGERGWDEQIRECGGAIGFISITGDDVESMWSAGMSSVRPPPRRGYCRISSVAARRPNPSAQGRDAHLPLPIFLIIENKVKKDKLC